MYDSLRSFLVVPRFPRTKFYETVSARPRSRRIPFTKPYPEFPDNHMFPELPFPTYPCHDFPSSYFSYTKLTALNLVIIYNFVHPLSNPHPEFSEFHFHATTVPTFQVCRVPFFFYPLSRVFFVARDHYIGNTHTTHTKHPAHHNLAPSVSLLPPGSSPATHTAHSCK
jgi:hypothetical protein